MMKKESAKCKCCDAEISGEACELAAYTTEVDGKTVSFCCQNCAPPGKEGGKK
jgi:hypothetical protein